ncbi:hypothetical protein CYMTET_26585 [Cymbomonas tetramitiformis]|uniref:Uncharacterized protein n=1 Tax=Cymbomonas tetramitiformis TaxID=36881 RepID=A0AAE0KXW1_9CHLO|nr:hypothetical protein CYMTET_26585 [Cymbomonas tetramitiformis]
MNDLGMCAAGTVLLGDDGEDGAQAVASGLQGLADALVQHPTLEQVQLPANVPLPVGSLRRGKRIHLDLCKKRLHLTNAVIVAAFLAYGRSLVVGANHLHNPIGVASGAGHLVAAAKESAVGSGRAVSRLCGAMIDSQNVNVRGGNSGCTMQCWLRMTWV